MSNLIKRLRGFPYSDDCAEAADRIESDKATIERLEAEARTLLATTVSAERYTKRCLEVERLERVWRIAKQMNENGYSNALDNAMKEALAAKEDTT